jgi:RTX calcium-binding nonapeptide repeat (4 copies)
MTAFTNATHVNGGIIFETSSGVIFQSNFSLAANNTLNARPNLVDEFGQPTGLKDVSIFVAICNNVVSWLSASAGQFHALSSLFETQAAGAVGEVRKDLLDLRDLSAAVFQKTTSILNSPQLIGEMLSGSSSAWNELNEAANAYDSWSLAANIEASLVAISLIPELIPIRPVGAAVGVAVGLALDEIRGALYSSDTTVYNIFFSEFQSRSGISISPKRGDYFVGVQGDTLLAGVEDIAGAADFTYPTASNTTDVTIIGNSSANEIWIDGFALATANVYANGGDDVVSIVGDIRPADIIYVDGGSGDNVAVLVGRDVTYVGGNGKDEVTISSGGTVKINTNGDDDKVYFGYTGDGGVIDTGTGYDTVDFSGDSLDSSEKPRDGVKINLGDLGQNPEKTEGTFDLVNVEKIILTQFKDEVQGNNQSNTFEGFGGDDILTGGGGADTLDGGADDDTADYSKESGGGIKITLGSGNISIVDGSGSTDTLISIEKVIGTSKEDKLTLNTLQTDIELDLGEGDDTVDLTNAGSSITVDLYSDKVGSLEILNAEHIIGTSGADDITGNDENNRIVGGGGVDEIDGGGGDDIIYNGDDKGSDDGAKETLYGGDGDDTYYIGVGDTVSDSDGNGQVFYNGHMFAGGYLKYWSRPYSPSTINDAGPLGKVWYDDQDTSYLLDPVFGLTGLTYKLTIETKDGKQFFVENYNKQDATLGIVLSDETPKDRLRSPLIIDLDGNGVQTSSYAGVYFDVDNDGIRELTGWSSPTDGLLALDINRNGRIDDVSELFGYGETITWPFSPGGQYEELIEESWTSGFEQLASLQTVVDGVLDSHDDVYNALKVWTDSNQNGNTDSGELFGLAELGISSINLNAEKNLVQQGQNWITDFSTVTYSDGTTSEIGDAWFVQNANDTYKRLARHHV